MAGDDETSTTKCLLWWKTILKPCYQRQHNKSSKKKNRRPKHAGLAALNKTIRMSSCKKKVGEPIINNLRTTWIIRILFIIDIIYQRKRPSVFPLGGIMLRKHPAKMRLEVASFFNFFAAILITWIDSANNGIITGFMCLK